MNWGRVLRISSWEYVQKVRARSFIVSMLIIPALIVFSSVVPAMLVESEPSGSEAVGLVDPGDSLYAPLRAWLTTNSRLSNGQPAYVLASYPDERSADSAVIAGRIEGSLVVRDSAGTIQAHYRSENPGNFRVVGALQTGLARVLRDQRMLRAGLDTATFGELAPEVQVQGIKISESGDEGSVGLQELFFTSYFLSFLLMILVLSTGGMLVRSLVEEKSNRIMEILVSSSTPLELMWGKLLGLSGLGLTQVIVWVVLGIGIAGASASAATIMPQLMRIYAVLPLLLLFLSLGYLFYSAIFIGLGSLVSTEQEAQVMQTVLVLILVTPMVISFGVIADPDASWVRVMSYIPVFTPSLMMLRIVTRMPAVGELIGTIAAMIVATVVVTWACARIFRTAILLTGKRPAFREVMRWVREAG